MNAASDKSTSVVVAIDGSPASDAALIWAAGEANSRREPLLIFTACPPLEIPPSSAHETAADRLMSSVLDAARMRRKEYEDIVAHASSRVHKDYPSLVIRTEVFEGDPRTAIELYESLASMLVLGSRGLGSVRTVLLGSVSFWATRHLSIPTVIVRPSDDERMSVPRRIAVGISAESNSEITLRQAFSMAARRGCPLTIANAAWDSQASGSGWERLPDDQVEPRRFRAVTELVAQIAPDYPDVVYQVVFARGQVDRFLASLGHTHSALVIGRRKSTLMDYVGLGTLASSVVEHAVGATVIIPIEGAQS